MKPNKVKLRSYCEAKCDCPKCHTGYDNALLVEECAYCQLKWVNKGEYRSTHRVYKSLKEVKF